MNNNLLYRAALKHFESQKANALATLQIYFNTSVGVAAHTNHVGDISRFVQELAQAEDAIQTLQKLADSKPPGDTTAPANS